MRTEQVHIKYVTLLYIYIENLLHVLAIYKEVLYKGCVTNTTQPMHKYKILSFKYMVLNTLKYNIKYR